MMYIVTPEFILLVTGNLYPLASISSFPPTPTLDSHHFSVCFYEFTFFRFQIQVILQSICLSLSDSFHQHRALKVHPCFDHSITSPAPTWIFNTFFWNNSIYSLPSLPYLSWQFTAHISMFKILRFEKRNMFSNLIDQGTSSPPHNAD